MHELDVLAKQKLDYKAGREQLFCVRSSLCSSGWAPELMHCPCCVNDKPPEDTSALVALNNWKYCCWFSLYLTSYTVYLFFCTCLLKAPFTLLRESFFVLNSCTLQFLGIFPLLLILHTCMYVYPEVVLVWNLNCLCITEIKSVRHLSVC